MSKQHPEDSFLDPNQCMALVENMTLKEGLNRIDFSGDSNHHINVEVTGGKIIGYVWTEASTGERIPSFTIKCRMERSTVTPLAPRGDPGTGDYCGECHKHPNGTFHCFPIKCPP